MNARKFACRQLLKMLDFTVHPPQCRYGGQAVAVLTLARGTEARHKESERSLEV